MNLRDLRYIIAVADHGHFGRASRACAVSQPTLSGQILKLERELGVDLFERDGKTVRPTAAGEPILLCARRAVTAADDLLSAAETHRDPESRPIRLGMIPTLAPFLMPLLLPALQARMPRLRLMLVEDITDRLVELVTRGEIDAALIASEPPTGLRDDALFDEPFWLVMPRDHPLAARETVAPRDISAESLLLLQDGHCLRDQALELCRRSQANVPALADVRATSLDTLLQMAAAGYGLTLMPELAALRETPLPSMLTARRLHGQGTSRRVRLVSRASTARRHVLERLATIVCEASACLGSLSERAISEDRRKAPTRAKAAKRDRPGNASAIP